MLELGRGPRIAHQHRAAVKPPGAIAPATYRVRAATTMTATKSAKSAKAAGVADGSTIAISFSTGSRGRRAMRARPRSRSPAGLY